MTDFIFISGTVLERNVMVGQNSVIGNGSVLKNCVVGNNVRIGENCKLENVFVWDYAIIGDNVTAENVCLVLANLFLHYIYRVCTITEHFSILGPSW